MLKNSRPVRRKCDGAPTLEESQSAEPHLARAVEGCYIGIVVKRASQIWGRKQGPICLSPAVLAWKLQKEI